MWQSYVPQAMAVVDALYEPSKSMLEGGAEVFRAANPHHSEIAAEDDAANVWRLMVDVMRKGIG